MQPEISRRCLVCGASPRAGARFCPQCGNNLAERGRGAAEGPGADVRPEARDGGAPVVDESAKGDEVGGEEVARAFEAWRGGKAKADEEARPAQPSVASEPARSHDAAQPPAPAAGEPEAPKPRRPLMPEPLAAKPSPVVDEAGREEASSKLAGAVGATRRRAASVVKESIAPRVERVRDRSLVMLEEAPDDSGLRFVLLAAFMFALFILLLVLSTVIK